MKMHFVDFNAVKVQTAYGTLSENGEWNGVMKMVLDGTADVVVADNFLSYERSFYVDMSLSIRRVM